MKQLFLQISFIVAILTFTTCIVFLLLNHNVPVSTMRRALLFIQIGFLLFLSTALAGMIL